ncbi:9901_t:CDS:10 [Entrophospora sp. SA101]|nr:9901_t:CDS:10 [Entrophospora sp. SA101]
MEKAHSMEQEEEQNIASTVTSEEQEIAVYEDVVDVEIIDLDDDTVEDEENEGNKKLYQTGLLLSSLEDVITIDQELEEKQKLFQLNYKKITKEISIMKETGVKKVFIEPIENLVNWIDSQFNRNLFNQQLLKPIIDINNIDLVNLSNLKTKELNWASNLIQKTQGIDIEIKKIEAMLEDVEESRKKSHNESSTAAIRNNIINSDVLTSSPNSNEWYTKIVAADELFKYEVNDKVKHLINFYQHEKFRAPKDLVNQLIEIVNNVIPLLGDKISFIRQTLSHDRHIGRWFDGSNESDKWISDTYNRIKQIEVPDLINKYDWSDEKQNIENLIEERYQTINKIKQDTLKFEDERIRDLEHLLAIELMEKQLKNIKDNLSKLKEFIDNLLSQTTVENFLIIIETLENLQILRNEITQIRKLIIEHNDADMVKDDVIKVEESIKNFEKQLPHTAENNLDTSTSSFTTASPGLVKALKHKHNKLLLTIQNIKVALAENKLQMAGYLSPSSPSSPTSAKVEPERIHGLTCNDDHVEELSERYGNIESELTLFERSLWVEFWLKSEPAKRLRGEEVTKQINEMEKKFADIKDLMILRQKDLQIIKEGREFAKGAKAIRDQLDIVKGKMRRQDTKTDDASIQELDDHMTETLEMLKNLESTYQHLVAPDIEDKSYREAFDEQQNQYNLVQAWIEEVKVWFKEAERMCVWINEHIVILKKFPQFDVFQEDKVPATQEQVDEWQDDCENLELETEKFEAEDMTRLKAHVKSIMGANISFNSNNNPNSSDGSNSDTNTNSQVNEAMSPADTMTIAITLQTIHQLDILSALTKRRSNELDVLALRVEWEREVAKALSIWNELTNDIKEFILNKGRWKQPTGIRDDDGWFINANQPNQKDVLIELESINKRIMNFENDNIPETGQILDELIDASLVEVPEHIHIRQENLEEGDLIFLKDYLDFSKNILKQRQKVLEYAQAGETVYINGSKLKNELIEEGKNPRGGSVEKKFIARVEELNKHVEQSWSNIGEKIIYPNHSNHDQNENNLVKEGVDAYHCKLEDLKREANNALKDYQDALRLLEKELLQRSDDLFNDTSNLQDWVDKRLSILEEHKVDPLATECLHTEEQVKDLLKEHEEFLAENSKVNLEDINRIKEGIEKLVEDIKSSKCDDVVDQKRLHDAFKKLTKKFAELQSKSSARQLDLSVLQPRANWEDQYVPGMQSLNDLIDEVNKFIVEKARWKPVDVTSSTAETINDSKQATESLLTETEKRDGDYDNESVEEKIGDNKAASIVPDTAIPILTATTTVIDHDNEHNEIVKEPNLDLNQKSDSSTQNIDDDQEAFSTEKDTTTLDEKDIDPDEKDAGLNEKEPIPEEPKLDPKEEFEIFTGKVKEFQENVLEPLKSSNKDMVSTIKNLLSKKCPKHLSDRQSDFEKKFDYLMDRVELGKNVLEQCDAINDFLNQAKDIIDWVNPHLEFLGKILKDDTLGELNEDKLHDLLEEVNKVESGKQAYTDVYELAKNLATVQLKKAEIDDLWQELQEAIPKTKQQLDQALQIVDFKEKIKETISKVENLSDIISSSLVDQVTKDNINDWQTELNDLEQTELSSLVKLHDNIQESLSTNDGAMNKKERAILENLLKSVEDKINDLKKLMDDKIDEVEAHRSAEITGAYLTRVNDLQSWIKGQFEDFLSGKSQHGIMVETSEQTNKENLENLSIIFNNFQKQFPEKFELFNSITEEYNNIKSQEGIRELQDVIKSQTELNELWENLDLGSNEFKDFINKVGKWYDQHNIIYRVEDDIFDGLEDHINKLGNVSFDNLEFEAKELDDKLQKAKEMLEEAKSGASQIVDIDNDILDITNRQNFNKHHSDATARLTKLSNLFQKALAEARNASLLAAFSADADKIISSCLEGTSIVESRRDEFNNSEYYSLEAEALENLINNAMIGFLKSEEQFKKCEELNFGLKTDADKLIEMNPEANKDYVQNILNKVTQALEGFSNSILAEKQGIDMARKIYPHTKASEDINEWISACKAAALNIQVGAIDQEAEVEELEENAMNFQSTIDTYKDMSQHILLPTIINDTNAVNDNYNQAYPIVTSEDLHEHDDSNTDKGNLNAYDNNEDSSEDLREHDDSNTDKGNLNAYDNNEDSSVYSEDLREHDDSGIDKGNLNAYYNDEDGSDGVVEARTKRLLEDWDELTDLLGNLRSRLNASKEAQEVLKAIKDISVLIGQEKGRVLDIESFFIGEGVPRLPTKDDVQTNLRELDEIQAEIDHMLVPKIEALDELLSNLSENEPSFTKRRLSIAEAFANLEEMIDNKRSQLNEAEILVLFGKKADEMNTLMSSLLEVVDRATTTNDGLPLSLLTKIELDARLIEIESQYSYYKPRIDDKFEDVKRISEPIKDDWRVLDRLGILKEQWAELIDVTNAKMDELRRLLSGQKARPTRHERSSSQILSSGRISSPTRNNRSSSASPRKRSGIVSPALTGPKSRQPSSRIGSPLLTPNRSTPSPNQTPGSPGSPRRPQIRLVPHTVNNYIPDVKDPLDVEVARIVNSCPVKIKVSMVEGEHGKYTFGEVDPKLCFCRILRSRMVMVRVGGGWAELSK